MHYSSSNKNRKTLLISILLALSWIGPVSGTIARASLMSHAAAATICGGLAGTVQSYLYTYLPNEDRRIAFMTVAVLAAVLYPSYAEQQQVPFPNLSYCVGILSMTIGSLYGNNMIKKLCCLFE